MKCLSFRWSHAWYACSSTIWPWCYVCYCYPTKTAFRTASSRKSWCAFWRVTWRFLVYTLNTFQFIFLHLFLFHSFLSLLDLIDFLFLLLTYIYRLIIEFLRADHRSRNQATATGGLRTRCNFVDDPSTLYRSPLIDRCFQKMLYFRPQTSLHSIFRGLKLGCLLSLVKTRAKCPWLKLANSLPEFFCCHFYILWLNSQCSFIK